MDTVAAPAPAAPPAAAPLDRLIDLYLTYQESRRLSPYTLTNYRSTFTSLRAFCAAEDAWPGPPELTTAFFRRYQGWLWQQPLPTPRHGRTARQAGTVAHRMRQLKAFCRWLREEGPLDQDVRFALPKLPVRQLEVLTDQEIVTIFRSRYLTGESAAARRNRALISLMLDLGLRLGEVARIEDHDLFLTSGWLRVQGKGDRERMAAFSTTTKEAITAWIAARDADPIEITTPGRGKTFELGREAIVRLITAIGRDTGLPLRAHLFRHTSATMMIRQGMDVATLQRILGHSSIAITQIYLHLREEEIKEKHDTYSPMAHIALATLKHRRRLDAGPRTRGGRRVEQGRMIVPMGKRVAHKVGAKHEHRRRFEGAGMPGDAHSRQCGDCVERYTREVPIGRGGRSPRDGPGPCRVPRVD